MLLLGWCIHLLLLESREHSFPVVWPLVTRSPQTDGWSTGGSEWLSQHRTFTPPHTPATWAGPQWMYSTGNIGLAPKFTSMRFPNFLANPIAHLYFQPLRSGAGCYYSTAAPDLSWYICSWGLQFWGNEVKQKHVPPRDELCCFLGHVMMGEEESRAVLNCVEDV